MKTKLQMDICYSVKNATQVKQTDLIKALEIYINKTDKLSETDTNQIIDYIEKKYKENRFMFFFVLYLNNEVCGFAEYAYLKKSKVLMLDYLCTKERNHTLFFNFYHMIFEEIKIFLESKKLFIEYILTELSLFTDKNKLTDVDSNYFRQVLSFEQFHILNIPYKQPYFNNELKFYEHNLAIKKADSYENYSYKLGKDFYISLISEIYIEHYLQWFLHYTEEKDYLKNEFQKAICSLKNEYPMESTVESISSVNCGLFEKGICEQIKPETITLSKVRKRKFRKYIFFILWIFLSIVSIIICFFQEELNFTKYITTLSTFLTLISGIITIIPYLKNKFIL